MKTFVIFAVVTGIFMIPAPGWVKQGLFVMLFLPAFCALLVYRPKRSRPATWD